jgi:hypothetical protein
MIADIRRPDSSIARQAEELARAVSSDMLFNHVMRCYWFGELFARRDGVKIDRELMFLSAVLHDLGLTSHASGPHRFEIEGAGAARAFLAGRDVPQGRAQAVWDNIALHPWDINLFRDDTSGDSHAFHPCTRIAHERAPLKIPSMSSLQKGAPFSE